MHLNTLIRSLHAMCNVPHSAKGYAIIVHMQILAPILCGTIGHLSSHTYKCNNSYSSWMEVSSSTSYASLVEELLSFLLGLYIQNKCKGLLQPPSIDSIVEHVLWTQSYFLSSASPATRSQIASVGKDLRSYSLTSRQSRKY